VNDRRGRIGVACGSRGIFSGMERTTRTQYAFLVRDHCQPVVAALRAPAAKRFINEKDVYFHRFILQGGWSYYAGNLDGGEKFKGGGKIFW
jgi:hypothetical protein